MAHGPSIHWILVEKKRKEKTWSIPFHLFVSQYLNSKPFFFFFLSPAPASASCTSYTPGFLLILLFLFSPFYLPWFSSPPPLTQFLSRLISLWRTEGIISSSSRLAFRHYYTLILGWKRLNFEKIKKCFVL